MERTGALELEVQQGLVDRADMLDVEGAVNDRLAAEDEQAREHTRDHVVGDA